LSDLRSAASPEPTVTIGTGATLAEALELAIFTNDVPGDLIVLPSSLRRTDRVAFVVRDFLRKLHVSSRLILPANPISELIRLGSGADDVQWRSVTYAPSHSASQTIRLDSRLLSGKPLWTVTDVDAVRGGGPFVLDLLARYVHPVSRFRFLGRQAQADAVVDVNLAVHITTSVIGKEFGTFALVGVTSDPIAAELLALAIADEDLPPDHSVIGPWEDRVVQRATELELGVRIPQELSLSIIGAATVATRAVIERVSGRIGVMPW
jgi:hypothetical protein